MAGLAEALLRTGGVQGLNDSQWRLERLARDVGGVDALMALDEVPLPDEEFDWTGVAEGIRAAVAAVL
jgi:hypothetical protein